MEILKKISWETINEYLEADLLIMQKHPTKDLFILNYSKTCQFERAWDKVTLACRGLVVNKKGDIVARPFTKFFNKEEYEAYEDLPNIPEDEEWEGFEKMDGSLGLMFYYDYEWIFASRGSFTSEQAIKGAEILDNYMDTYSLNSDFTYIFEIIYPENRIVINYGKDEKLVLLGVINTETGEDYQYDDIQRYYGKVFTIVTRYDGKTDFEFMKSLDLDNKEGYVVRFKSGFRMKIKFEEYCRLHSIVTNVSNKIVWSYLRDGISFEEMLNKVPDEFYSWVKNTKKELEADYNAIEVECLRKFIEVLRTLSGNTDPITRKKDFALNVKGFKYSGILFSIYDDKDYSKSIWSLVKPSYAKPFKDGVEE